MAPASFRPPAAGGFFVRLAVADGLAELVCNSASRVWVTSSTMALNRHRNTASRASSMARNCSGVTTSSSHRSLLPTFPVLFRRQVAEVGGLQGHQQLLARLEVQGADFHGLLGQAASSAG